MSMTRLSFGLFSLLGTMGVFVSFSSPASAQLEREAPLGSRIPVTPRTFPTDDSRYMLQDFARCIVKGDASLSREFVLKGGSRWLDPKYIALASVGCLDNAMFGSGLSGGMLMMQPTVLRYIVAEELVKTDLPNFDPMMIRSAGPLEPMQATRDEFVEMYKAGNHGAVDAAKVDRTFAKAQNALALFKFGECVVRAKPEKARKLLDTKINSNDEGTALVDLVPTFSSCLDVGHQFATDRAVLRGTIAFNYYRLAYSPRVARPVN